MIHELAEICKEIIEMKEAYPLFPFFLYMYSFFSVFCWELGRFIGNKICLKRSKERLNNKNGSTAEKKGCIEQCKK